MARYIGGPCDGLPLDDTFTEPRVCGGVTYVRSADGNYRPDTSASGPVGTAALGSHAPKGWAHLQKALNRKLPTSLQRSQAIRRSTLRMLAHRRRVK